MDKIRGKSFADLFNGKHYLNWEISSIINFGKSAIVLHAKNDHKDAAFKIFDPELVGQYGMEIQEKRIERELNLKGHSHPNLIEIYDGGYWPEEDVFFIIMEYLPWKNMAQILPDIPTGFERSLIAQVAKAAQYLEGINHCHRDIKPENILISPDYKELKLLDFGVIRPIKDISKETGSTGDVFLGTLRYSPPEFLLREEEHSVEGWRAISFYQLGGVLHDLIMRRPLFEDYQEPFAKLVNAVQHIDPEISSSSVSFALQELARHCLLKKPRLRLQLITWDQFENEPKGTDDLTEIKGRISRRLIAVADNEVAGIPDVRLSNASNRLKQYIRDINTICRNECISNVDIFPPLENRIHLNPDGSAYTTLRFEPSTQHEIYHHLQILFSISWIDSEGDVVDIFSITSSSEIPFTSYNPNFANKRLIYQAIYAGESVRRAVLFALYSAIETEQISTPSTNNIPKQ